MGLLLGAGVDRSVLLHAAKASAAQVAAKMLRIVGWRNRSDILQQYNASMTILIKLRNI
jgi:hypothetical protein